MNVDFVNSISRKLAIQRSDLIEKDIILHQLLTDLSKDKFFARNFIFKGGTCLIKCYYGYKRFSEDIDFTWKRQTAFNSKSQNQIRKDLSRIINETGSLFEKVAANRGLEFKCKKSDRNFVELGGSNKFCTFKIWYHSEILRRRSFVKVQINFVEKLCYKPKKKILKSLLRKRDAELKALFPEYAEYSKPLSFAVYDVREILSEKVRALLTRRGTKARDFLDVYLIYKNYGIKPKDVEGCIKRKISFALGMYERFRSNMNQKLRLLNAGNLFDWGEERGLLLSEIDEDDFYRFISSFQDYLKGLVPTLVGRLQ